jgi:hypothetical protein
MSVRDKLYLSSDDYTHTDPERLAEAMLALTPTSGSDADDSNWGVIAENDERGGLKLSQAVLPEDAGSPPPMRPVKRATARKPSAMFSKESVLPPTPQQSLLSATLAQENNTSLRRNAHSFDMGDVTSGRDPKTSRKTGQGRARFADTHGQSRDLPPLGDRDRVGLGATAGKGKGGGTSRKQPTGAGTSVRSPERERGGRSRRASSLQDRERDLADIDGSQSPLHSPRHDSHNSTLPASKPLKSATKGVALPTDVASVRRALDFSNQPLQTIAVASENTANAGAASGLGAANAGAASASGPAGVMTPGALESELETDTGTGMEYGFVDEGRVWQTSQMLSGATVSLLLLLHHRRVL